MAPMYERDAEYRPHVRNTRRRRPAQLAPSPSDPAVGACWSKEEDGLLIRLADAECDTELYEKGTTLRQSLLGYSA